MKKLIGLGVDDKLALKTPLEQVTTDSHVTIKDLRQIDKICALLETDVTNIEFEDADFAYLKKQFGSFTGWNPSIETRKIVIAVSDKLEDVK